MNVREIIEGATPHGGEDGSWLMAERTDANLAFLSTFDPTHVAAMEEVVEATRAWRACKDVADAELRGPAYDLAKALQRLDAIRGEGG